MQTVIPNLRVADLSASMKFYEDVLGFATIFTLPGEDGSLLHAAIRRGDVQVMFGPLVSPWGTLDGDGLGKGVSLYMWVGDDEDIDALFAHARDRGATVVQEPTDQFWGERDWAIADPDGYVVYVSKTTRQVSPEEMKDAMLAGAAG